jgi:hypothetical protein
MQSILVDISSPGNFQGYSHSRSFGLDTPPEKGNSGKGIELVMVCSVSIKKKPAEIYSIGGSTQ